MALQTGPFSFHTGKTSRSKHREFTFNECVQIPGSHGRIQKLHQGEGEDAHILWADLILHNGRRITVPAAIVRPL